MSSAVLTVVAAMLLAACSAQAGSGAASSTTPGVQRQALFGGGPSSAPTTASPTTAPAATVAPTTVPSTTAAPTTTTTTTPVVSSWRLGVEPSTVAGCSTFDRTSVFHSVTTGLPVHARSAEWISELGNDQRLAVGISSLVWMGSRPGMPVNIVDSNTLTPERILYDIYNFPSERWVSPLPIPAGVRIEGDPGVAWDRHILLVDRATCTYTELFYYDPNYKRTLGIHWAAAVAQWQLGPGGALTPQDGTTVSGAPLLATTVRLDEVTAGRVDHVVAACSQAGGSARVWPALRSDGTNTSPSALPMGARLRLRSSVDVNSFTGQARVIAEAMRTHGVMITDTCFSPLTIMGENVATGWDDANLASLKDLRMRDFEVVDASPMKISESSWQVR